MLAKIRLTSSLELKSNKQYLLHVLYKHIRTTGKFLGNGLCQIKEDPKA